MSNRFYLLFPLLTLLFLASSLPSLLYAESDPDSSTHRDHALVLESVIPAEGTYPGRNQHEIYGPGNTNLPYEVYLKNTSDRTVSDIDYTFLPEERAEEPFDTRNFWEGPSMRPNSSGAWKKASVRKTVLSSDGKEETWLPEPLAWYIHTNMPEEFGAEYIKYTLHPSDARSVAGGTIFPSDGIELDPGERLAIPIALHSPRQPTRNALPLTYRYGTGQEERRQNSVHIPLRVPEMGITGIDEWPLPDKENTTRQPSVPSRLAGETGWDLLLSPGESEQVWVEFFSGREDVQKNVTLSIEPINGTQPPLRISAAHQNAHLDAESRNRPGEGPESTSGAPSRSDSGAGVLGPGTLPAREEKAFPVDIRVLPAAESGLHTYTVTLTSDGEQISTGTIDVAIQEEVIQKRNEQQNLFLQFPSRHRVQMGPVPETSYTLHENPVHTFSTREAKQLEKHLPEWKPSPGRTHENNRVEQHLAHLLSRVQETPGPRSEELRRNYLSKSRSENGRRAREILLSALPEIRESVRRLRNTMDERVEETPAKRFRFRTRNRDSLSSLFLGRYLEREGASLMTSLLPVLETDQLMLNDHIARVMQERERPALNRAISKVIRRNPSAHLENTALPYPNAESSSADPWKENRALLSLLTSGTLEWKQGDTFVPDLSPVASILPDRTRVRLTFFAEGPDGQKRREYRFVDPQHASPSFSLRGMEPGTYRIQFEVTSPSLAMTWRSSTDRKVTHANRSGETSLKSLEGVSLLHDGYSRSDVAGNGKATRESGLRTTGSVLRPAPEVDLRVDSVHHRKETDRTDLDVTVTADHPDEVSTLEVSRRTSSGNMKQHRFDLSFDEGNRADVSLQLPGEPRKNLRSMEFALTGSPKIAVAALVFVAAKLAGHVITEIATYLQNKAGKKLKEMEPGHFFHFEKVEPDGGLGEVRTGDAIIGKYRVVYGGSHVSTPPRPYTSGYAKRKGNVQIAVDARPGGVESWYVNPKQNFSAEILFGHGMQNYMERMFYINVVGTLWEQPDGGATGKFDEIIRQISGILAPRIECRYNLRIGDNIGRHPFLGTLEMPVNIAKDGDHPAVSGLFEQNQDFQLKPLRPDQQGHTTMTPEVLTWKTITSDGDYTANQHIRHAPENHKFGHPHTHMMALPSERIRTDGPQTRELTSLDGTFSWQETADCDHEIHKALYHCHPAGFLDGEFRDEEDREDLKSGGLVPPNGFSGDGPTERENEKTGTSSGGNTSSREDRTGRETWEELRKRDLKKMVVDGNEFTPARDSDIRFVKLTGTDGNETDPAGIRTVNLSDMNNGDEEPSSFQLGKEPLVALGSGLAVLLVNEATSFGGGDGNSGHGTLPSLARSAVRRGGDGGIRTDHPRARLVGELGGTEDRISSPLRNLGRDETGRHYHAGSLPPDMNNPEIIAGEDGRSRPVRTYDVRTREGTRHSEQMGNEAVFQVTGNPPALQLEFQANAPVSRVSSSDPAARTRRMGPSRVAVEIANGSTPEIRVHVRKKAENATVSVRERRR